MWWSAIYLHSFIQWLVLKNIKVSLSICYWIWWLRYAFFSLFFTFFVVESIKDVAGVSLKSHEWVAKPSNKPTFTHKNVSLRFQKVRIFLPKLWKIEPEWDNLANSPLFSNNAETNFLYFSMFATLSGTRELYKRYPGQQHIPDHFPSPRYLLLQRCKIILSSFLKVLSHLWILKDLLNLICFVSF